MVDGGILRLTPLRQGLHPPPYGAVAADLGSPVACVGWRAPGATSSTAGGDEASMGEGDDEAVVAVLGSGEVCVLQVTGHARVMLRNEGET